MADKIPADKYSECKEIFDLFDKNGDGSISSTELDNLLRALGAKPTPEEIQEMINEVDKDNSGRIEFNEFLELYSRKMNEPETEEDLIEAFRIFDRDGNGLITRDELRHVMTTLGEKLTEEEADEMLRQADINQDGYINIEEFIKFLMN